MRAGPKVLRFRSSRKRFIDTNPAKNREVGDPSVSFQEEILKPRNAIDLLRAGLGSVMLLGTLPGIDPALDWETSRGGFYVTLAILLLSVLIQVLRFEARLSLFPPIFYFAGLTFGLCGIYPALFAWVLVWTINLALPNPLAFLTVHALLVTTFALLFGGLENPLPFVAAGLIFLPALLSLLTRRRLVLLSKRVKHSSSASSA